MKKISAAILVFCFLTVMCFSAFAEQESQFLWGVSPDEYIAAYGLTDYETNELTKNLWCFTMASSSALCMTIQAMIRPA